MLSHLGNPFAYYGEEGWWEDSHSCVPPKIWFCHFWASLTFKSTNLEHLRHIGQCTRNWTEWIRHGVLLGSFKVLTLPLSVRLMSPVFEIYEGLSYCFDDNTNVFWSLSLWCMSFMTTGKTDSESRLYCPMQVIRLVRWQSFKKNFPLSINSDTRAKSSEQILKQPIIAFCCLWDISKSVP